MLQILEAGGVLQEAWEGEGHHLEEVAGAVVHLLGVEVEVEGAHHLEEGEAVVVVLVLIQEVREAGERLSSELCLKRKKISSLLVLLLSGSLHPGALSFQYKSCAFVVLTTTPFPQPPVS